MMRAKLRLQAGEPGRPEGYTLLELLVVLAMIALLVSALPLSVSNVKRSAEARSTSDALVNAFRSARQKAIDRNVVVSLRLNETAGTFEILPAGPLRSYARTTRITILRPVTDQSSLPIVLFYPDGSSPGANFQVTAGGRTRVVTITPVIGRIRVEDASGR